ncbi:hypothetical protein [Ralstonia syzygii]|uniref:hypothetical protein n=1 Tax=Ralstonia syzygii TaxID=28097 RepID=UPI0018D19FF7|nr:hypothetical protein [Ralstonia syzygii]
MEHALHVSFLVTSLPPRQKAQFRLALIQILEGVGHLDRRQAEFLDYLYGGSASSSICFDGLTGEEIRAQCAMVVSSAKSHLLTPERNAIFLRYACGMPARPGSAGCAADAGMPPSMEWKQAMVGLRTYLRPSLTLSCGEAILALLAGHSRPKERQEGLSYKEISDATRVSVRTLERNAHIIRKRLRGLEQQAVLRLTPLFERDGVIATEDVAA